MVGITCLFDYGTYTPILNDYFSKYKLNIVCLFNFHPNYFFFYLVYLNHPLPLQCNIQNRLCIHM